MSPNGLNRKIYEVILIVNPLDYFTKIMPATAVRQSNGTYLYDIFPFPTRVIQSVHQPVNEAIIGIPKRYFMGLGTAKGGKVEYSDEYYFLEDERVYLTKLYGNGMPLDSRSFRRLDIENLVPTVPNVFITNDPLNVAGAVTINDQPIAIIGIEDARLSSLKIGSLTLSPVFNKSVMVYHGDNYRRYKYNYGSG